MIEKIKFKVCYVLSNQSVSFSFCQKQEVNAVRCPSEPQKKTEEKETASLTAAKEISIVASVVTCPVGGRTVRFSNITSVYRRSFVLLLRSSLFYTFSKVE